LPTPETRRLDRRRLAQQRLRSLDRAFGRPTLRLGDGFGSPADGSGAVRIVQQLEPRRRQGLRLIDLNQRIAGQQPVRDRAEVLHVRPDDHRLAVERRLQHVVAAPAVERAAHEDRRRSGVQGRELA